MRGGSDMEKIANGLSKITMAERFPLSIFVPYHTNMRPRIALMINFPKSGLSKSLFTVPICMKGIVPQE
jgi:hypothetical protein